MDSGTIISFLSIVLFIAICVFAFILIGKNDKIKELNHSIGKLMRSFNELDEQAKIIVRTDLELNKTQEELDKRLNDLNTLQKASRLISTTLDKDEIFKRLKQSLFTELGYEKNLILMFDQEKNLHCRIEFGSSPQEIDYLCSEMMKDKKLHSAIREGHAFSSASSQKEEIERIQQLFDVEHFILSPILTQDGVIGLIFVGGRSDATVVTESDVELISILSNQVGQSIENAELFEQVYRSRQGLESTVQDRTKQLASALEEVQKINKMKSEFISAVSHELRTPLTSIKGYASILMTGKIGDIPQQVKDRLEKINKHSDNLVHLINELLDIARIESGRSEMKFTKNKIGPIIDNVRDLLTPQIKEKEIELITKIEDQIPEAPMDETQIERVFINLVSNAVKFTPHQGTISIESKVESNNILCSVTDTGIGIKEEDIEKLFEEFYRVENEINQNVKGTGLGLPLVKKIIEAHKGKIWVQSKLNESTSFYFTIPISHDGMVEES